MKHMLKTALFVSALALMPLAVTAPAVAQRSSVTFDFGGVAVGYHDGYYDRERRWHRWENRRHAREYRTRYSDRYYDRGRDRYPNRGWRDRY